MYLFTISSPSTPKPTPPKPVTTQTHSCVPENLFLEQSAPKWGPVQVWKAHLCKELYAHPMMHWVKSTGTARERQRYLAPYDLDWEAEVHGPLVPTWPAASHPQNRPLQGSRLPATLGEHRLFQQLQSCCLNSKTPNKRSVQKMRYREPTD